MKKLPETKLIEDLEAELDDIAGRFAEAAFKVPFPKHKKEAVRKLKLMQSQLAFVQDMKGPAKMKGVVICPGGSKEVIAIIVAPNRKLLLKKLANFARFDPDVDITEDWTDSRALDALERTYDLYYKEAFY